MIDTAPTGHTLLLLDATGSNHRDIALPADDAAKPVTPTMRLRDPAQTRVLIVTLPQTTPVLEAAHLQDDFCRAAIKPWGWFANASLAATGTRRPLLAARAATEAPEITRVRDRLATRLAVVPMLAQDPEEVDRLRAMAGSVAPAAAE